MLPRYTVGAGLCLAGRSVAQRRCSQLPPFKIAPRSSPLPANGARFHHLPLRHLSFGKISFPEIPDTCGLLSEKLLSGALMAARVMVCLCKLSKAPDGGESLATINHWKQDAICYPRGHYLARPSSMRGGLGTGHAFSVIRRLSSSANRQTPPAGQSPQGASHGLCKRQPVKWGLP